MNETFVHLQVASNYSLLYGARSIEEIVIRAKNLGFHSLALTDINNLYGVHDFLQICKKEKIKPIIGSELRTATERAVVLVKTGEGFSNLSKLITAVKADENADISRELMARETGTIILTDSPALLEKLSGSVRNIYGMITPTSEGTIEKVSKNSRYPLLQQERLSNSIGKITKPTGFSGP